jgi:hypothetical protein
MWHGGNWHQMETVCRCQWKKTHCVRTYVEQYTEDFTRGVSREWEENPVGGYTGEWKTTDCEGMVHIHGTTNGVWRQHSVTIKKTVQVFSYDSKDDTVYIHTISSGFLSKEETMEASSDRHRPPLSDFQDDDTLRWVTRWRCFRVWWVSMCSWSDRNPINIECNT